MMEFDIVYINLLIQFLSFVQEIFLMIIIVHLVYLMLIQEVIVVELIEFYVNWMMMKGIRFLLLLVYMMMEDLYIHEILVVDELMMSF